MGDALEQATLISFNYFFISPPPPPPPPPPSPSTHTDLAGAAIAWRNMIVFAGGTGEAGNSDVIDIYDEAAGTWSVKRLSQPRAGLRGATVGGNYSVFVGGEWKELDSTVTIRASPHPSLLPNTGTASDVFGLYNGDNLRSNRIDYFDGTTVESNAISAGVENFALASVNSVNPSQNVNTHHMFAVGGTDNIFRDGDLVQHFCHGTEDECKGTFNTPTQGILQAAR